VDWWVWLGLSFEAAIVTVAVVALLRIFAERRSDRRPQILANRDDDSARMVAAWGENDLEMLSPGDRAVRSLAESWALWPRVPQRSVAAIRAAAEAIAFEVDSPSLRELAGLSERHLDLDEVRDLLADALDELGVMAVSPESDEGQLLALRYYCLEWREGRLGDEKLAEWAHAMIGHDGPLLAQELVELEDLFVTPGISRREEVAQAVGRFLGLIEGLKPVRQ
jgi:hypothetical protein